MAGRLVLNPHPPEFEPFLHASVGEDMRGSPVTVLSALARLNLDPWAEAADLAALGREAAATRLGALLVRVRDVQALGQTHDPVGRELLHLLPQRAARFAGSGSTSGDRGLLTPGVLWAVAGALFLLAQMIFGGSAGTGE